MVGMAVSEEHTSYPGGIDALTLDVLRRVTRINATSGVNQYDFGAEVHEVDGAVMGLADAEAVVAAAHDVDGLAYPHDLPPLAISRIYAEHQTGTSRPPDRLISPSRPPVHPLRAPSESPARSRASASRARGSGLCRERRRL